MRLINADSLKKNLIKWMKQDDPTHPSEIPPLDDMIVSTIMTVEEEPTVDAIPVDWLREQEESVRNSDAFRDECAGVRLAWQGRKEE